MTKFSLLRLPKKPVKAAAWIFLLLLESWVIPPLAPANAQSTPEERIFGDDLPPPLPSSVPTIDSPPSSLPSNLPREAPPERELNFQAPEPLNSQGNPDSSSYFVIIPGEPTQLSDIAAQISQLGFGQNAVQQRAGSRGAHVAVGPFDKRQEADYWSSYLQSMGMDARVHFGR
ncbi:hypothetical protein [Lyngbya aestuarii]|uniref:hypothetical protein n=1 Tax=Lyngbya aestuarii TaxID=118322 RepID=UPI00403DA983